jgi:hypothetical protein
MWDVPGGVRDVGMRLNRLPKMLADNLILLDSDDEDHMAEVWTLLQ